jgi:hypothetical protein
MVPLHGAPPLLRVRAESLSPLLATGDSFSWEENNVFFPNPSFVKFLTAGQLLIAYIRLRRIAVKNFSLASSISGDLVSSYSLVRVSCDFVLLTANR